MTPSEQIIAFLRNNANCCTRAHIEQACGIGTYPVRYALYKLLCLGVIGKAQYGNNDYRYFLIDDALYKSRNLITASQRIAIRKALRFEKFRNEITPMIEKMPGRSSLFYAELLGQSFRGTTRRLQDMQKMGLLFADKRFRPAPIKNVVTLWWIKGTEPENLSDSPIQDEDLIRKNRKSTRPNPATAIDPITEDDNEWLREASKSRQQRLQEMENDAIPIPSYAEFFKQQSGRF